MSLVQSLRDACPPKDFAQVLALVCNLSFLISTATSADSHRWKVRYGVFAACTAGFLALFLAGRLWLGYVTKLVPEPYLDEVFHVPQAQRYFDGKWSEWDDKITTPPGVYWLSILHHRLWWAAECTAYSLRSLNLLATLQVAFMACLCRRMIESHLGVQRDRRSSSQDVSLYAFHTALNVALFPILFFFSGLYYTDVMSALLVLVTYFSHLHRMTAEWPGFLSDLSTVLLGVCTLLMRQTNVFWVVVFMGGMEAVHAVKREKRSTVTEEPSFKSVIQVVRYYGTRYSLCDIHDLPVNYAWPDDWLLSAISICIAAICNPVKVLRQVWPYVAVLALFTSFVAWNGGVVLGDKSNHVATIHLAQMLYLWPFFAFFSAPMLLPSLLPCVTIPLRIISSWAYDGSATTIALPQANAAATASHPSSSSAAAAAVSKQESKSQPRRGDQVRQVGDPKPPKSAALKYLEHVVVNKWYFPVYMLATTLLSLAVVKYNTLIHPFTLADNRHYMFYIFRYSILRPGPARYFLVAAYTASRWLVWRALEGCRTPWTASSCEAYPADKPPMIQHISTPFETKTLIGPRSQTCQRDVGARDEPTAGKQQPQGAASTTEPLHALDSPRSASTYAVDTSTALLWLLATTLSLITAPLVEPRYFILPWVFWRLNIPAWPLHDCSDGSPSAPLEHVRGLGWLFYIGRKVDIRLVLETIWFLAINGGTMYIFLSRPYLWKLEDGTVLDGGRLQRFMW